MKVYTEKDLEGFERDDFGRLICPSGDYTQTKSFGEQCSFGEGRSKEYLAACDLAELMLMEEER